MSAQLRKTAYLLVHGLISVSGYPTRLVLVPLFISSPDHNKHNNPLHEFLRDTAIGEERWVGLSLPVVTISMITRWPCDVLA